MSQNHIFSITGVEYPIPSFLLTFSWSQPHRDPWPWFVFSLPLNHFWSSLFSLDSAASAGYCHPSPPSLPRFASWVPARPKETHAAKWSHFSSSTLNLKGAFATAQQSNYTPQSCSPAPRRSHAFSFSLKLVPTLTQLNTGSRSSSLKSSTSLRPPRWPAPRVRALCSGSFSCGWGAPKEAKAGPGLTPLV